MQAKAKAVVPRRVVDRLGDEVVREMAEARRSGAKSRELVERYKVSESSLKRLLRASTENSQATDGEWIARGLCVVDPHLAKVAAVHALAHSQNCELAVSD